MRWLNSRWARGLVSTAQTGPPGTYYNSQLGSWIRKSGVAGVRFHEVSLATCKRSEWAGRGVPLLPRLQAIRTTSIDMGPLFQGAVSLEPACASPVFAVGPILRQAEQLRLELQSDTLFSVAVADAWALDQWLAIDDISAQHKMVTLSLSCPNEDVAKAVRHVESLTAAAHAGGLQVKARLAGAFLSDEGQTDLHLLSDMVQGLADAGADLLILQGQGEEEEDDVRDCIETILGLDVSGESMFERLGLQVNPACTRMAAALGISHFEAASSRARPGGGASLLQCVDAVKGKHLASLDLAAAQSLDNK